MTDGSWTERSSERVEYEPWHALYDAERWPGQSDRLTDLQQRDGYEVHDTAFVAETAHVVAEQLRVGEYSFIAAGCLVRGSLTMGDHCSLNAGAVTMGKVTLGSGVRVAGNAVLCGFNHVFSDLEMPIWLQGLTEEGVVVEDDVWIGANVAVLDGVTVGAHSVIAAGSVVSRDIPAYSVVAGVPARVVRSRLDDARSGRRDALTAFDELVAAQWSDVLDRCQADHAEGPSYVDQPGAAWGPRPQNDAIEIAAAFGEIAPQASREEWTERLRAQQDARTGLFVDPGEGPGDDPLPSEVSGRTWPTYGLLSTGYALEVLGSAPEHPVHAVASLGSQELRDRLDRLDMGYLAWPSGSWIDAYATGVHLNRSHHGSTDDAALLWGWLLTHQHPDSGVWGSYLPADGTYDFRWLMAVNGFYRLTRGTYAQFGVPVPNPEAAIDTVLAHCRDWDWFAKRERTACNMLDVVHPLWLLGRQTDYRESEIRAGVSGALSRMLDDWVAGEGFAFRSGDVPGLQGTEMWLSIVYLAADVIGESDGLSWQPRGVHRLEPADSLGA